MGQQSLDPAGSTTPRNDTVRKWKATFVKSVPGGYRIGKMEAKFGIKAAYET